MRAWMAISDEERPISAVLGTAKCSFYVCSKSGYINKASWWTGDREAMVVLGRKKTPTEMLG